MKSAITAVASLSFSIFLISAAHPESAGANPQKRKYSDVRALMKAQELASSGQAKVVTLTTNDLGTPIEAIQIGNGPVENLVVATHHGNEYGSTEVAIGLIESLVAQPVLGQTITVIPVLNATGYDLKVREERKGSRTFDPNRDYPGPCGTSGPFALKSTKALADLVATRPFVNSVTLHTFYNGVLYPWGISSHDLRTAYEDLFVHLGKLAASFSNYRVGNSTELLYPADGTFEDYAFWKHGLWSLLFEMGLTHSPDQTAVKKLVAENVPGIRKLFEEAPTERAKDHAFNGKCDVRLMALDRRDE
jgi:carboxypeptidase T